MANDKERDTRSPEEIIREQRILDNIMVPVFFESDSPEAKAALQEILRTLLGDPDLTVEKYHAEHVMSNTGHHGVRIDVWARVGKDRQLALELQKVTDDEVYPRALFESATMIVHSLHPGAAYDKIDDIVVIFFTSIGREGPRLQAPQGAKRGMNRPILVKEVSAAEPCTAQRERSEAALLSFVLAVPVAVAAGVVVAIISRWMDRHRQRKARRVSNHS